MVLFSFLAKSRKKKKEEEEKNIQLHLPQSNTAVVQKLNVLGLVKTCRASEFLACGEKVKAFRLILCFLL